MFFDNCNQLIFYRPIHSLSMLQDTGNRYGGASIKKNLFVIFFCFHVCCFWCWCVIITAFHVVRKFRTQWPGAGLGKSSPVSLMQPVKVGLIP